MAIIKKAVSSVNRNDVLLLYLFIFLNIRFYNCTVFNETAVRWVLYILDFIIAIYFLRCFLRCRQNYKTSILGKTVPLIFIMFSLAVINGIYNGQSAIYVVRYISKIFAAWGVFYFLLYKRFDIKSILDVLWKLVIGYMLIRILCYIQFPNCWFGLLSGDSDRTINKVMSDYEIRGVLRVSLPFAMIVPLFIFCRLNQFKFNLHNLIYLGVLSFYMILLGNRFPLFILGILGSVIVLLGQNIKTPQKFKLIIAGLILLAAGYYLPFTHDVMINLISLTEKQSNEAIRITMATYMFTEFNGSNLYKILFGNGLIVPNAGGIADIMEMLSTQFGFYTSDVGYCYLYINYGIAGVLLVLLWFVAAMRITVQSQYVFIKHFILFIMLSMIAGGYWFENLMVMSILTYVLIKSNAELLDHNVKINIRNAPR